MNGVVRRAVLSVLLLLVAVALPTPAWGTTALSLRFEPSFAQARAGETTRLEIWIEEAADLDRLEFAASYPAEVLEPVDADLGRDGTQIEVGPVFQGGYVPQNEAQAGMVHLMVQRAPAQGPFSGQGVVAAITFRVREGAAPGTYPLRFDPSSVRLLDPDGRLLAVGALGEGTVRVPPAAHALTGWITREGTARYGRTAVTVFFYPSAGSYPAAWARACTDDHGDFLLSVPEGGGVPGDMPVPPFGAPAGPYEWAYIRLDFPNHGSECYWEPLDDELVDIGWHTLEGGDVNRDGCINIYDIVRIIADFGVSVSAPCFVPFALCPAPDPTGSPAPPSDVNGDCRVNIFDLTMAAENFGLCTNCP